MPSVIDSMLIGAGNTALNTGLGAIIGLPLANWNDRRQLAQQQALNDQQVKANQQMQDYNAKTSLQMWKDTNYQAQVKQMERAGLNVGLMYAHGGQGGTTQISGSNAVSAHGAPTGGNEIGMGIQSSLQSQQSIENANLAKSQAKLAEANIPKVEAETSAIQTTIPKLIAETKNEAVKGQLMQLQSDILDIDKAFKPSILENEIAQTIANTNKLKLENAITTDAYNSIVMEIQQRAIGQTLQNAFTAEKTNLTTVEERTIATAIAQKWTELGLHSRSLDQIDYQNKIRTFEAEMQAEYPSVWNVVGDVLKKTYKGLEILTSKITGGEPIKDTVK